jgi:hypothetical protein
MKALRPHMGMRRGAKIDEILPLWPKLRAQGRSGVPWSTPSEHRLHDGGAAR